MKFLTVTLAFWYAEAGPDWHRPHHVRTRGSKDAGPLAEASSKFMKNAAHVNEDDGDQLHVHDAVPHVDAKDPAKLQKEIERMAERMMKVGVENSTIEIAEQLDDIETSLENSGKIKHSEIVATREELCAERGFEGHQLGECERFMHKACGAGANSITRGPAARVPKNKCEHFYLNVKRNTAAKVRMDARRVAVAAAPSPGPSGAPGGPATRLFGGKFRRPLPDQGFMGELNQHEDKKSGVGDWQREFGYGSGHRTERDICADHPNNEWCRIHGYYKTTAPIKSAAAPAGAAGAAAAALASCLLA